MDEGALGAWRRRRVQDSVARWRIGRGGGGCRIGQVELDPPVLAPPGGRVVGGDGAVRTEPLGSQALPLDAGDRPAT